VRDRQHEGAGVERLALGLAEIPGAPLGRAMEEDGRCHAHVEALGEAAHGDAHAPAAGGGELGVDPFALVAEHQGEARDGG